MLRWNALLDAIIVQCRNEYGNKSCSGNYFGVQEFARMTLPKHRLQAII